MILVLVATLPVIRLGYGVVLTPIATLAMIRFLGLIRLGWLKGASQIVKNVNELQVTQQDKIKLKTPLAIIPTFQNSIQLIHGNVVVLFALQQIMQMHLPQLMCQMEKVET